MTEDQKKFHAAAVAACEKYGRKPLVMLESKSAGRDSGWMDFTVQRWSLIYSGEEEYDLHRELDDVEGLGDFLCFSEARCLSVAGMAAEIVQVDNAEIFFDAAQSAEGEQREPGSAATGPSPSSNPEGAAGPGRAEG